MGVKTYFEVQNFKAVRFIGKEVLVGKKNRVPDLWEKILNDGTNDFLQSLPERVSPLGDTIGWMGEYQWNITHSISMPILKRMGITSLLLDIICHVKKCELYHTGKETSYD